MRTREHFFLEEGELCPGGWTSTASIGILRETGMRCLGKEEGYDTPRKPATPRVWLYFISAFGVGA